MTRLLAACALLVAAFACGRAQAAITCNVTDTDLDYGTVALPIAPVTSTSLATVTCTGDRNGDRGSRVLICIGLNVPLSPRRMVNGASFVSHRIFRDAAYAQEINYANINAETTVTMPNSLSFTTTLTMYGRLVTSSAGPIPGLYSETVTGDMGWSTTATACDTVPALRPVSFVARARINPACTIVADDLAFGVRTLLAANIDATTSIGLNCTNGAPWTLALSGGGSGNVAARRMLRGGTGPASINYQLRHTSSSGPLWGDGTGGTATLAGTGTGASQTVTVFGRVPGGQPVPAVGTYSDTVTATVDF